MVEIDVYRIGTRRGPWHQRLRGRFHTDRWGRGWQAEWVGCQRAVRGWTETGTRRKGTRKFLLGMADAA